MALPQRILESIKFTSLGIQIRNTISKRIRRWDQFSPLVLRRVDELEGVYTEWYRNTLPEPLFRHFYENLRYQRFESYMDIKSPVAAIAELKKWQKSPLWNMHARDLREKVAFTLSNYFFEHRLEVEELYRTRRSELEKFLRSPYHAVWVHLADKKKPEKQIRQLLSKQNCETSVADKKLDSIQKLTFAEAWAELREWKNAGKCMEAISHPEVQSRVKELKSRIAFETQQYEEAFQNYHEWMVTNGAKSEKHLKHLLFIAERGRLWHQADFLAELARSEHLSIEVFSAFQYFCGRAYYLLRNCTRAISTLQQALRTAPTSSRANEARYQLAHCFKKKNKKVLAQALFEDLSTRKDIFWSRIARNEIQQ